MVVIRGRVELGFAFGRDDVAVGQGDLITGTACAQDHQAEQSSQSQKMLHVLNFGQEAMESKATLQAITARRLYMLF